MTTDPVTDRARHLLDWITNTGTVRFSSRDAFTNQPRSRFPKMADLGPALALLEQHGYVRRLHAPPIGSRGGRPPAAMYEVYPSIATDRDTLRPPSEPSRSEGHNHAP